MNDRLDYSEVYMYEQNRTEDDWTQAYSQYMNLCIDYSNYEPEGYEEYLVRHIRYIEHQAEHYNLSAALLVVLKRTSIEWVVGNERKVINSLLDMQKCGMV